MGGWPGLDAVVGQREGRAGTVLDIDWLWSKGLVMVKGTGQSGDKLANSQEMATGS